MVVFEGNDIYRNNLNLIGIRPKNKKYGQFPKNIYNIGMEINKDKIYSTQELMDLLLTDNPGLKSSSLYYKIDEYEKTGIIARISKSKYVFKQLKSFSYSLEYKLSINIYKHIKKNFSTNFDFDIYETTTVLNQFLNHLINRKIIIIEAPRLYLDYLFDSLKEGGFKNILVNPTQNEIFKYAEDETIIIMPLISKSPFDKFDNKITLEKLIVDIIVSPVLNCFYEGAEIPNMINDMLLHYKVKYDTLKNYAKRRNAFNKLMEYVPPKIKELFND